MRVVFTEEEFRSRKAAHAALQRKLGFPDYYGKNLDALHDCLTEIGSPMEIVLPRQLNDEDHLGEYGNQLILVFEEAVGENHQIKLKVE